MTVNETYAATLALKREIKEVDSALADVTKANAKVSEFLKREKTD